MPVRGVDIVVKNLIKVGGGFSNQVNKTMEKVKVIFDQKVTENISLVDHSLKDLRDLKHPYSLRRWGPDGLPIHTPNYQIHKQSGKLLSSKKAGVSKADIQAGVLQASAFVKLDPNVAKHAEYLVYGTSKMIPRSVLTGSRSEVLPEANKILKQDLKNLVIGFK